MEYGADAGLESMWWQDVATELGLCSHTQRYGQNVGMNHVGNCAEGCECTFRMSTHTRCFARFTKLMYYTTRAKSSLGGSAYRLAVLVTSLQNTIITEPVFAIMPCSWCLSLRSLPCEAFVRTTEVMSSSVVLAY